LTRVSKNPEDRRNEMLDAAEELFSGNGYIKTAVSDIVKRVGVSQGTFYYYFKSKTEIADALVKRIVERVFVIFSEKIGNSELSPVEKLTNLFVYDIHGFDHEEGMGKLFSHLHDEENSVLHQKLNSQMINRFAPLLADIIDQGKSDGVFRSGQNALYLAEFLLTGYQFWTDTVFFKRSEKEQRQRNACIGGIIEALLVTKPGTIKIMQ
jgi:AcrR family transcriptional regulator